jgi:hypothetical protein
MRSNSGKGKSHNNLLDPTMKEHEERRKDVGKGPAQAHGGDLEPANSDEAGRPQQPAAGPIDRH